MHVMRTHRPGERRNSTDEVICARDRLLSIHLWHHDESRERKSSRKVLSEKGDRS